MAERLKIPQSIHRSTVYAAAIFCLFMFYMLKPINFYLWDSMYATYYQFAVPVLIGFYFYFRRLNDGIEVKLMAAFCVWLFISRLLNGDVCLERDYDVVLNMFLSCVFLALALSLNGREKQRFLDWFSAAVSIYYTLLGVVGIYSAIHQAYIVNPITGATLCQFQGDFARLAVLDTNSNICALWFFLAFWLLVYQFFRYKNWALRTAIILAALINHTTLALTFSRNVMLTSAGCAAMLMMLLALKYLHVPNKKGLKAMVIVLVACAVIPLAYKSYGLASSAVGEISYMVLNREAQEETAVETEQASDSFAEFGANETADRSKPAPIMQTLGATVEPRADFTDHRGFADSGRFPVYKNVLYSLQKEPLRLLRGCMNDDVMKYSREFIGVDMSHCHNAWLQVLMYTGIPGLAIVLAFTVLLVIRMVKLFFTGKQEAAMATKILTIPVTGMLVYNMLETLIFSYTDVCSLAFFVLAGFAISYSKEICKA